MNNYVSLLICFGYSLDYVLDVAVTILFMNHQIDVQQEQYLVNINSITLAICIFAAYVILIKVFMGYH